VAVLPSRKHQAAPLGNHELQSDALVCAGNSFARSRLAGFRDVIFGDQRSRKRRKASISRSGTFARGMRLPRAQAFWHCRLILFQRQYRQRSVVLSNPAYPPIADSIAAIRIILLGFVRRSCARLMSPRLMRGRNPLSFRRPA
jgi:hypothetical protein